MDFKIPAESYVGKINEVIIGATPEQGGTRSHSVTIGGSTSLPFHFFEGASPNRPLIAMEVFDQVPAKYPEALMEFYNDVIDNPAGMAKKCVEEFGADLISIRLEGTHPEKGNKSADEAVDTVKQVLKSVKVPLIITGHGHYEKINEVMKKICDATAGENCLINFVETDNYRTIAAAALAYNHSIVAQSPIDVNIAKQLNIMLTEMNFPEERIVIDPLTGALGYGLEYTYSIMERIRIDGLSGDKMLAFPMLVNPGNEASRVKEAKIQPDTYPEWGDPLLLNAYWELSTAMSLLCAGADLLIMYNPRAVEIIKTQINNMFNSKYNK